jgi:hypothetical protein
MIDDLLENFSERWVSKERAYPDELHEFFTNVFSEEFSFTADDGSIEEVSAALCLLVELIEVEGF